MPTVDLPAHSVSGGFAIVGDGEAVATTDTATYAVLAGADVAEPLVMYGGGDPGFGWIEVPGATVTNLEIVALCQRLNGGDYPPEYLALPDETAAETYPTIQWQYDGMGLLYGRNIDHLPVGEWGWVADPVPTADWFRVLDPSDLPPGEGRLSPSFEGGPINASFYFPDARVHVAYLAARVTYTDATAPGVIRQYPRDDARGLSSAPRLYPPPKARRIVGGYQ